MSARVRFCGVIEGSVAVRKGETEAEAIDRVEHALNAIMERHAKSFSLGTGASIGPVIGLDQAD